MTERRISNFQYYVAYARAGFPKRGPSASFKTSKGTPSISQYLSIKKRPEVARTFHKGQQAVYNKITGRVRQGAVRLREVRSVGNVRLRRAGFNFEHYKL